MPWGGAGGSRRFPRRGGPAGGERGAGPGGETKTRDPGRTGGGAVAKRYAVQVMYTNTGIASRTGRSAIREPQSGTTNWDVNAMRLLQSSSIIAPASALLHAVEQDERHQRHRHAERDQHHEARPVH